MGSCDKSKIQLKMNFFDLDSEVFINSGPEGGSSFCRNCIAQHHDAKTSLVILKSIELCFCSENSDGGRRGKSEGGVGDCN